MRSCNRHAIVATGAIVCALGEVLSGCGARDAAEEENVEHQSSALAAPVPPTLAAEAAWRGKMLATPVPKPEGCFHASHPNTVWEEVPCGSDPGLPYPPAHGAAPQNVGNGTDYAGTVANNISQAVGSFVSVTGVTSETGTTFSANCTNPVSGVANIYALQLNTNRFGTGANGCGVAGCQGWQQFIYSRSQNQVFMQYWMINHGACPVNWNTFGNSCWKNSALTNVPSQPITNLVKLSVTAKAASGGNDQVTLSTGDGNLYTATGSDSVLALAPAWNGQEFNVFGDSCGSQANFNNGSTIVVQTAVSHSNKAAPFCTPTNFAGWTGETNNLNLVAGSCCPSGGTSPAFRFTETNAAGVKAPFCLLNDVTSITEPLL